MIRPGILSFKTFDIFLGIRNNMTSQGIFDILDYLVTKYGVVVTESWRERRHENDLHGYRPLRAVDVRSWCYDDPQAIADEINERWQYDASRPNMKCAIFHDSGQGDHIHIQVHPRTEVVENSGKVT